ncbi:MAG: IS21 family transposase [Cyclobacteriaceae bacterium]
MANKVDVMDLKQIINLHLDGVSNRQIASLLSLNRNTVNHYMRLFKSSDLSLKELLCLDEGRFSELFSDKTTVNNGRFSALMLFFEAMHAQRNHPGFTLQYHYRLYEEQTAEPYSYTQFTAHYRRRYKQTKSSIKLNHPAGKELYVDFAGKKLQIVDPSTGEISEVEVFIATLPFSQYTYVEACKSQKREDFIHCLNNALQFFGGVPRAIVSDNLKSAVTRSSKYEAVINKTFKEFAIHYSCAVNPTRSYRPQDKALVENAVQLTYQRIYYPMRRMRFFSLEDLNAEIKKLLAGYNDVLFQRKESSRKELFQSVESALLKALPSSRYQIKEYASAKVQKMGYVYFSADKTYYSVPYRYIGCQTQLSYTPTHVEVYYKSERIALHNRLLSKGAYITNKSHLSSTHQAYHEWSPGYFTEKGKKLGVNVELFMTGLFLQADYPEINYKRANGILQLAKIYGKERVDKACLLAVYYDIYSYQRLKNILENNMDAHVVEQQKDDRSHIPKHQNIRGKDHYN